MFLFDIKVGNGGRLERWSLWIFLHNQGGQWDFCWYHRELFDSVGRFNFIKISFVCSRYRPIMHVIFYDVLVERVRGKVMNTSTIVIGFSRIFFFLYKDLLVVFENDNIDNLWRIDDDTVWFEKADLVHQQWCCSSREIFMGFLRFRLHKY